MCWTYFAGFIFVESNIIAVGFGYSRKEVELGNADYAGPIRVVEDFNSERMINITGILPATTFSECT